MVINNKHDLVKYLISCHKKRGFDISRIKLQKALYFLYAFYGANIRILNLDNDAEKKDEELFNADFEAWAYGPVDRNVYFKFKEDKYDISQFNSEAFLEELDDYTRGYLLDMTDRVFNTSDFSLVELSHEDLCWKSHFDRENPQNSDKIPNDEIISEYTLRNL